MAAALSIGGGGGGGGGRSLRLSPSRASSSSSSSSSFSPVIIPILNLMRSIRHSSQPLYFHKTATKPPLCRHHHHHHHHLFQLVSTGTTNTKARASNATTSTDKQQQQQQQQQQPHTTNSTAPAGTAAAWSEFAAKVSGEWDGFGADFTPLGNPIELPESVVPQAYRDWEVKVFDWQTQCPTLAHPHPQPHDHDNHLLMFLNTIRLLPTVGCEADAATRYSVDRRNVLGRPAAGAAASAFAYQASTGCYVAVWPTTPTPTPAPAPSNTGLESELELEHCLINPQDKESRVRIILVVRATNSKMEFHKIRVFCEQWYGPFRNGDQLGGCAIRDSAFASTPPLKASDAPVGLWQGPRSFAHFHLPSPSSSVDDIDIVQQLSDGSADNKSMRDECDLILLPKQLWCSLTKIKDGDGDGETCFEVGWMFDHGRTITSRCIFSTDAELKEVSVACETASNSSLGAE